MSVYFVQIGKYVKVGYSADPHRRSSNLFQSSTLYSKPWDCPSAAGDRVLLGYVPGDLNDERVAHAALDDYAVGCEFFMAEPDLLAYVQRCLAVKRVCHTPVRRALGPSACVGQVEPNPDDDSSLRAALDSMFPTPRGAA